MSLNHNKKYIKLIRIVGVFIIIILISLFINSQNVYAKEKNKKNVLLINSYDRTYTWTSDEVEGIIKGIDNSGIDITLQIEYMDWKNYPEEKNSDLLKEVMRYKYSNKKIDIIITTDDAALDFALENRNEIFGQVPIVFSGIYSQRVYDMVKGYKNVTGAIEKIDAKGTIESALNIIPDAKNLYLIHDDTESGKASFNEVTNALNELAKDIKLVSIDNLTIDNLENDLPYIGDGSIVLMSSFSRDINGKTVDIEDMTQSISNKINKPIFQLYEMTLGHGTIGGSVLNAESHGEDVAQIAIEILNGKDIASIPIKENSTTENIYDKNIMDRFGVKDKDLPTNSIIINKKFSFYETYKKIVWIVVAVFMLLVSLVIFLLINIINRRKAESELIKNNYELSELYEELAASDEELRSQYELLEENKDLIEKNEEMYRLVFETTNDGLWEINLQTGERFFSERWHNIFGIPKEKITDMSDWFNLVHPEDYNIATSAIDKIIDGTKESFSCDYRILSSNGQYKWIHAIGKAMKDHYGKAYRIAGSHSDIHDKKIQEEQIKQMAYFDSLTGLANRTQFVNKFKESISTCSNIALIFMDLDNFKNINDSFGHTVGDELLIEIANRIKKCVKENDVVARLGGDEFLILITEVFERKDLEIYLNIILEQLGNNILINGVNIITSASLGAAIYPKDGNNFEDLFKNADTAMYKAKESGKRSFVFFEQWMNDDIVEMVIMENQLRKALDNNEFILYYQPKSRTKDSKIEGFEALIRWNNPFLGMVSPLKFISIAEKTGLIIPIGKWVLENACKFIKDLHEKGYKNLDIAINVSVIQLIQKDFIYMVNEVINKIDVDPKYINIEITESILMESIDANISKINKLKENGIKISLDDFGKGYSSLTYLKDIPFDTLKIDKLFIDELVGGKQEKVNGNIVGTIIKLAHQMQLNVVAEGVETMEQYKYLIENDCDYVQGYYISKPLPEEEIEGLLRKYNS